MSTEKKISPEEQEAIDFIKDEVANNESLPALLVKFSNTDNKQLLDKIHALEAEVREKEQFAENANDEKHDAEEESSRLRNEMSAFEELNPKSLEEDLKLSILKRIYKNLNLAQIEALEFNAKVSIAASGGTYQDYD